MSIARVDTYIRTLPLYFFGDRAAKDERQYQSARNYWYKETVADVEDKLRPHPIAITVNGDLATWAHIDFDPYEAWLGRPYKSLLDLAIEPYACSKGLFCDDHYGREEDGEI